MASPTNLPPGIVLDCMVAELVYGYPIVRTDKASHEEGYRDVLDRIATFPVMVVSPSINGNEDGTATEGFIGVLYKDKIAHIIWSPSKNPTFALKVQEKMLKHGMEFHCEGPPATGGTLDQTWHAWFNSGNKSHTALGVTFAHALCLAAVACMEDENDKERDARTDQAGHGTASL